MNKLTFILCFLLSWPVLAADIKGVSQQLAQPTALVGQFAQEKHMQLLSMPLKSSGSFVVIKDVGVVWKLEQPVQSTMTITEQGLKGVDIEDNRAMQYVGKLLMQLLSGDFSSLEQQFKLVAAVEDEQWQLVLEPRSSLIKKAVESILLSGGSYINSIELHESGGDKTVIQLLNQQEYDQAPKDALNALQAD